ncbi:MAG: histidine-type phosphatase [Muribaculaceae bacterium]|nr:histidine-type phosphatase [Muribaculaceae bacterium]
MRRILFLFLVSLVITGAKASDPTATRYPAADCQGSLKPYPVPEQAYDYPDSLTPVFINHVGRHGSRYPASATNCIAMKRALLHADSIGSITPLGRKLLAITEFAISNSNGRWGALDSLGMAEQRGIASRMYSNFPSLFNEGTIQAISSYSPRCAMSMYSFTHQLARLNNRIELSTSSGRSNSPLMRPFDIDKEYTGFRKDTLWSAPYNTYIRQTIPATALERVLGSNYPFNSRDEVLNLALVEYYVIAGMSAMEINCNALEYFTTEEYNALWSCFNLRQYLQRTATTVSTIPADIASPLLVDLITSTDAALSGESNATVRLRFGHAETLMPLLSLMRLDGCYYMTNYFDTVAKNWKDFNVVPMSANIQLILFKSRSGKHYIRLDHNENPVKLIPGNNNLYIPWDTARDYLMRCIPIYYQP